LLTANGFGLGEGGDFQHQLSYEAQKFIYPQNCPTKHCTATFAKPVLPAGVLSVELLKSLSILLFSRWFACRVFNFFRREGEKFLNSFSVGKGESSIAIFGLRVACVNCNSAYICVFGSFLFL